MVVGYELNIGLFLQTWVSSGLEHDITLT